MAQMLEKASSGHRKLDLESQQTAALVTVDYAGRKSWRGIYMMLRVHKFFSMILVKAQRNQLAVISSSSAPSYTALPSSTSIADHVMLEKASSGHRKLDLESQQTAALVTVDYAGRKSWRGIYMMLRVHKFFSMILVKAQRNQLAVISSSSAPSYTALPSSTSIADHVELEVKERTELPIASPQVSQDDAHLDTVKDQSGTVNVDAKLQRDNIAKIVRTKNLHSLNDFGGINGIAEALNTNLENGIPGDEEDLHSRRLLIGTPLVSIPQATEAPAPGFFGFLGRHCNDCTILLLFVAAALYTGYGIKKDGLKTGWYQGVIIVLAVSILVAAPTIRDLWLKHSRSKKVDRDLKEQNEVEVFRGGCLQKVSKSEIMLGEVVSLNEGSLVPADGLFIDGEFLVVNDGLESSIEEESPFLFHGSKVSHGRGRMLVTSVGADTELGEAMSKVAACAPQEITLPAQLDKLRKITQITGLSISILITLVLLLELTIGRSSHVAKPNLPDFKSKPTASREIMGIIENIVINASEKASSTIKAPLAIVLVGVLEGIPFLITLAAIYWRKRMLSGKAYAPGLLDCVKMGSATTICTDKILLNSADVATCFIGDNQVITRDSIDAREEPVQEAFCDGISTPLVMPSSPCKVTEDPLLPWTASNLKMNIDRVRRSRRIMETKGLSSNEKGSGVLMKKTTGNGEVILCSHWKGPATTILGKCSSYYDTNGEVQGLNEDKRKVFQRNIKQMEDKDLETVAFAKQIANPLLEDNKLTLVGMMGIKKDTCCAETKKALKAIQDAGVKIRLVSEDDVSELEDIASACGILPTDGLVIKGEEFRNYDEVERINKIDKICVMGNSLPSDRLLLVQCLKKKGNVVVALGSRTNESPTLKEANLGISMGTWGSEIARESSDIIVYDGSLNSLLTIISCGRCTYHNIQKYIQLELVTNIAGTLIASISTIWLGDTPITGIHLIWANLIVTILSGPALLMEPPRDELMHKSPVRQTEPLISKPMWRNIVIQAIYQTAILVTFHFKGQAMMHITKKVSKSMIFSSFVLCQVFNQVNSRELEKINVFKGIHRNPWFGLACVIIVAFQAGFTEVSHILVGDARLSLVQWSVCVLIGIGSCSVDLVAKCVSDFIK